MFFKSNLGACEFMEGACKPASVPKLASEYVIVLH